MTNKTENFPKDACYMCVYAGKMNLSGNIPCTLTDEIAEPYYVCDDFKKREKIVIQDEGDYYSIHQQNVTDKVVDKNVIIATKMSETEFEKKYGLNVDHYTMQKQYRYLIRTDNGLLFFDEETNDKILLN